MGDKIAKVAVVLGTALAGVGVGTTGYGLLENNPPSSTGNDPKSKTESHHSKKYVDTLTGLTETSWGLLIVGEGRAARKKKQRGIPKPKTNEPLGARSLSTLPCDCSTADVYTCAKTSTRRVVVKISIRSETPGPFSAAFPSKKAQIIPATPGKINAIRINPTPSGFSATVCNKSSGMLTSKVFDRK
jgi:hypothetical protein